VTVLLREAARARENPCCELCHEEGIFRRLQIPITAPVQPVLRNIFGIRAMDFSVTSGDHDPKVYVILATVNFDPIKAPQARNRVLAAAARVKK
jgi:hypothetical protein